MSDETAELRAEVERLRRRVTELEASEADLQYRVLVEITADAVIIHQDGVIVYANPAALSQYGAAAPEDMVGRPVLTLVHPDERVKASERIRQALGGTPTPAIRMLHVRFDGTAFPAEVVGSLVQWQGRPAVQALMRDVSGTRQVEEALKLSEKIYRAIGESIDYGVWVCDPDGRNTYASESFLNLVGMTQAQCSDFGWGEVLHPDDAEKTIAAWKECVRTEGKWDFEHRFRGVDGRWHPILARGAPVRDESGKILCWAGINLDISSRKEAEEALRQREAMLDAFFEASPGILHIEDAGFHYIKVDRTTPKYFGLEREDVIGRSMRELAPNFLRVYEPMLRRVMETGRAEMNVEVRSPVPTKLGEIAHWRASYFPVPLPDGTRGIGVVGVEITDLKKTEAALEAAKGKLERVLSTITEGYYQLDREWRFVELNAVAAQHFGKPARELAGRNIWEVTGIAPGSFIHERFQKCAREAHPSHLELASEVNPGAWFDLHLYPHGGGLDVYFHDITDRKRAQESLEQAKRLLEALMEYVPEGITVADRDLRLNLVSRYGTETLGRDFAGWMVPEVRSGCHIYDKDGVTPLTDSEVPLARAVLLGESVRDQELVQLSSTGERLTLLCNAAPIRDGSGAVTGGIVAWRDISERKRMEEALRRSNQDLEQFAYAASHDLQEPLRMVAIYTDLLSRKYSGRLDDDADQFISYAVEGARRMQTLLQGLLEYSRVSNEEAGVSSADAEAALAAAKGNLAKSIAESDAVITNDPLPAVGMPQVHLVQLLQNLIGNAIRYRSEAAPVIHVSAEEQGHWLRFAVADNGIGIKPQYHGQIFGVFKRLHGSGYPGTGIGLAICKRIVERQGGRIWVESELGRGSTFCFVVPAAG